MRRPRPAAFATIRRMSETPLVLTCAGRRIGVNKDTFSLGRARDNDLPIRSPNVSRRHCVFERRGDDFFILDQGSATGIELRGARIQHYKVEDGDVYQLNADVTVRATMGPAPLTELHTEQLRVITIDLGGIQLAKQADDIRNRDALPFEVRGVLLAGPKGSAVMWRDDRVGRSGLARGPDSFTWNTAAFPLLRGDAAPDGITVRLMPQRSAEPVTLFETARVEEANWRCAQDIVYLVSRIFPNGARTGDEIDRQMSMSRI
jgi:pSer/pThr/pTyr-binding forkhead associated (FHA) protein